MKLFVVAFALAACASADTPAEDGAKASGEGLRALEARAHAPVEAPPAPAAGGFVIVGATVMTADGHRYEPGYVAVEDGRIAEVGGGPPPKHLDGVARVDGAGKWLTPGIVDMHSHLGVFPSPSASAHGDGNERTAPNTAGVWAEHAVFAQDPGFQRAAEGGVTTLTILPGSANLFGGRGVTLHLRPACGGRAMRLPGAPDVVKMACGENPKRVYGAKGRSPSTRMGSVRDQRETLLKAARWLAEHGDKPADELPRDLEMESLAGVLSGRILAQVHCYRADDMLAMLQLADEVGFSIRAFHHALEAYKIRDILAAKGVAVATWADWWGFKMEAYDGIEENAALVHEAGGRAVIHSDSAEGIQRLNQEAAKAYHAGRAAGVALDEDMALAWITRNPAWAVGIDDQVGSITRGKRADLVLWDAHPFSVYAKPVRVWVDGALTVDASRPSAPWSDFELGQEVLR